MPFLYVVGDNKGEFSKDFIGRYIMEKNDQKGYKLISSVIFRRI